MTIRVMIPTVHMNGTDARDLLAQNLDALAAIGNAIEALRRANPHGRDFYPQGQDAFTEAQTMARVRLAHLSAIKDELTEIVIGLRAQERDRRRAA